MNWLAKFKQNRRGYYSLLAFLAIFVISLFAEFISSDKPLFVSFRGHFYFPIIQQIPENIFDGEFATNTDYRDKKVVQMIERDGFVLWTPLRFSYDTINYQLASPAPSKPSAENILGTDDQGRDVFARALYGIRTSLLFGLVLTFFTLIIAIFFGAIQGYFAGLTDIFLQRFSEIWSSMPILFLLIIMSSILEPSVLTLMCLLLIFSWMGLASFVRAEFLRIKNFDFVLAARALGASNLRIIFRHILPNATPIIIANLPFLLSGSIITLTSLDFLGFGLPVGSPSLGELLAQGKNNINAWWLGVTGFVTISFVLTLLIFIGEALRDSFDSRI